VVACLRDARCERNESDLIDHQKTVRMAALQSGCFAYLTKPFSAKSLIKPIRESIGEAHAGSPPVTKD
jgi:CheY-like chemotaxis protein